ncbi:MAG: hypothetical protein B7Y05_04705 [Polynucleobacter sp. 24-46-87]|jgi:hypothetical protein|uniref:DUF6969 family protein n=1 Tax=unclassified Polynucleobacter TaxID=2640945 RepID=UPI000BD77ED0|nr:MULTISPECIES: hypothetical protein [unclassified Polynucleobacter]OYY09367.1 MAG: hypothetical protein B7Y67_15920 [Polynucleobacter sp. 35-46-11]OZA15224.1 MAG: hypothetical protein B7Y05_04705 [Polynucleobacter sp. 24-46-87]OZA76024.1 MAG: hypothetical protein B7X71_09845 [Polynucleobacter sp. 39-46-10]
MLIQSTLCLAAQEIASIQTRYAKKGLTLSEAALCGAREFIEWNHYPKNDLLDPISGYEFYYHAHAADEMLDGEHGHFHLFKRNGVEFHHLIGIALNQQGLPVRLFTTNQWVTGEKLISADLVLVELHNFDMATKGRLSPVSRWVSVLTKLFFMDMEALIVGRDRKIGQLEIEFGDRNLVLDSRNHHVLTESKIDLLDRLSQYLLPAN